MFRESKEGTISSLEAFKGKFLQVTGRAERAGPHNPGSLKGETTGSITCLENRTSRPREPETRKGSLLLGQKWL